MGQKIHPIGMRVGIIRDWDAKWYAEKEYAEFLHEDLTIRKFISTKLADAAVSTFEIPDPCIASATPTDLTFPLPISLHGYLLSQSIISLALERLG